MQRTLEPNFFFYTYRCIIHVSLKSILCLLREKVVKNNYKTCEVLEMELRDDFIFYLFCRIYDVFFRK